MPVKKFRTLTDAERELWLEPGDPRIWEGLRRRWALHRFFNRQGRSNAPGVRKYRSVAERQGDA